MAGHSKWAKLKHFKGAVDAKRGKIFSRISRDITIAAKSGGGDPNMNPRLRTLLLKARESNMPADNIDRAIKKGTGELPGVVYEDAVYEGYAPGGVAMMVKVTSDNKNRAAAAVRSVFTRYGGNLAGANAVAFQFLHAGQFLIGKDDTTEDRLMEVALDAGADDIITTEEGFELRCAVHSFDKIAQILEEAGIKTASSEIAYIPANTVPVDAATAASIEKLHDALDEIDDVQQVFSNEETPD
ncbi:MAG: YebC/PmpR family DNA-binding transcriptional regulator [Opitutaceae bacterium]|jgi:YebC/PmpR family DNA-binding regulatory protein|nr:YebC/PmpR family DNA-binding transcriptional regulator [Opitutaceae bacterium]